MNRVSFAMALHFHQPIGNFQEVIEKACKNCYFPFIGLLRECPDIKMALHISGCLFDYFEREHPEFLDKIMQMARRGQVELLSGAYYEPILIAIPFGDLVGQVKMMSKYISSRFGYQPQGMWIPERVWKPELAAKIGASAIKYCILDDTHLLKAAIKKEEMYGYFLTGSSKKQIAVFPSDKKLRYLIPFKSPREIIGYFTEATEVFKNPLFTYGDDVEKFGEWPGTHKWVFEEKWLKNFFDELIKNKDWIKLVHLSDYLSSHPALAKVNIPEASYDEMIEWTGGSWLNFLTKYPETNQMHKKMLYVSRKLKKAEHLEANDTRLNEARRELYQGQCNCGYWHGVFGGIYLYHLRCAIYNHLIEADKIIDELGHKKNKEWVKISAVDFDLDKKKEIIMESPSFGLYLDPDEAGVLKELDWRPISVNLINTLSRHKEPYHQKIKNRLKVNQSGTVHTIHEDIKSVDPLISEDFIYDSYPRYCLRDHFISSQTERKSFANGTFRELGSFAQGSYKAKKKARKVILKRQGSCLGNRIKLIKEVEIASSNKLEFIYHISKKGSQALDALFGVEFNLTMPFLNSKRYSYVSDNAKAGNLDDEGGVTKADSFGIVDTSATFSINPEPSRRVDCEKGLNLNFIFSKTADKVWFFPLKTISQSERAYELNFQCSTMLFIWQLNFDKDFKVNIDMVFNS